MNSHDSEQMKNNGYHQSSVKSDISAKDSDDQSVPIIVQKVNTKTHKDFQIKYQDDDKKFTLFIDLCPADLQNLIKESVSTNRKLYEDERKRIKNCIFFKKIETPNSRICGNFHITYVHYQGLTFNVFLNRSTSQNSLEASVPLLPEENLYSRLKLIYDNDQQITEKKFLNKWIDSKSSQQDTFSFLVPITETGKILKNHLLLQIIFDRYPPKCDDYRGLQNEGNMCYLNSFLQVLYHFVPLRKLIIEATKAEVKKKQLIKFLQQIFVDLSDGKVSPNGEILLKIFGQFNTYPRQQQDIHEFMISLFDELERQCPETNLFWCGKDCQFIRSMDDRYRSKQEQNFNELQLHMTDVKGNSLKTIQEAMKQLLKEEKVEDQLETDQYGKLAACRNRQFESLPPLLFLNIKRYEYNAKRKQLRKINLDQSYDLEFDASFLMNTPGNQLKYVLYAVVIHKGRSPHAGHYFTFLNLSKDPEIPDFYQFNDSIVSKVSTKKVLADYTGKKKQQIYLSEAHGKWGQREIDSQETAYMLVYILKQRFAEFQTVEYSLPSWHIERLQRKLTEEQAKTKIQCKVMALKEEGSFNIFYDYHDFLEIKLNKQNSIEEQMQTLEPYLDEFTIGTIWKINNKTKNVKHTGKIYGQRCQVTLSRLCEGKQGNRKPDYFLLISQQKTKHLDKNKALGLLHIEQSTQEGTKNNFQIIDKTQIDLILEQMRKTSKIVCNEEQLQYFKYGWNDYLNVTME